jgi:hypothetical protein
MAASLAGSSSARRPKFGSAVAPGRKAEPAPKAGPLRTMVAISSGTPSGPEGCARNRFLRRNFRLWASARGRLGWPCQGSAGAIPFRVCRGLPIARQAGTGRSAASPSKGSSLSWRIERALLNMVRFPAPALPAPKNRRDQRPMAIRFGRKALLVLLYPTGCPLWRLFSRRGTGPTSGTPNRTCPRDAEPDSLSGWNLARKRLPGYGSSAPQNLGRRNAQRDPSNAFSGRLTQR